MQQLLGLIYNEIGENLLSECSQEELALKKLFSVDVDDDVCESRGTWGY